MVWANKNHFWMNIIQSINSVYVLFFVIKMHFYIMKNPFYPLNIKKLNFILIYLLFSILVCMWPFFLAEDFFLSFHGMHLMGGVKSGSVKTAIMERWGVQFLKQYFVCSWLFWKLLKKKNRQTFMQNVFPLLSQTKTFFHCSWKNHFHDVFL